MTKMINIDPKELSDKVSKHIFARWAAPGKLISGPFRKVNQWNVAVAYGRIGSKEEGKILMTFVTHDDIQVDVKFSGSLYIRDPEGYLQQLVMDITEMMNKRREDRSPLVLPDRKAISNEIGRLLN